MLSLAWITNCVHAERLLDSSTASPNHMGKSMNYSVSTMSFDIVCKETFFLQFFRCAECFKEKQPNRPDERKNREKIICKHWVEKFNEHHSSEVGERVEKSQRGREIERERAMRKLKWIFIFDFYEMLVYISIYSGKRGKNSLMMLCLFVDLIPFSSNLMFIDKYLQV